MAMTTEQAVAKIKQWALDHYSKGWDVVVECWSDADIAEYVMTEGGYIGARKEIGETMRLLADMQAEHDAEARNGAGGHYYGERY